VEPAALVVVVVVAAPDDEVEVAEVVVVELVLLLNLVLAGVSVNFGTVCTAPYHFLFQLSHPALSVTKTCSRFATWIFPGEFMPVAVAAPGIHFDTRLRSSGPLLRAKDSRALRRLDHCDDTAAGGVAVARMSHMSQALTMVLVASPEMRALAHHSATLGSADG